MSDGTTVVDLVAEVHENEVLRYLGYARSKRPSPRVERALGRLLAGAPALARPRGAFRLVEKDAAARCGMPRPTRTVGLGLCTVGPALEEEMRRLIDAGDVLGAMILDAFGSAAAEATAEALGERIRDEVLPTGNATGARISPGYGSWDVARQAELFALLPAKALGVSLTEGMMMVPRKSVSFAVRLGKKGRAVRRRRGGGGCPRCRETGCPYRIGTGSFG